MQRYNDSLYLCKYYSLFYNFIFYNLHIIFIYKYLHRVMNYELLKNIISEKGLSLPKLAEKIGVDKTNIYRTISNESLSVEKLEDICKVLDINISTLFEGQEGIKTYSDDAKNEIAKLKKDIDNLKELIDINQELKNLYTEQNKEFDKFKNAQREQEEIIFGIEDYVDNKNKGLSHPEKLSKVLDLLAKVKVFESLWPLKDKLEGKVLKDILNWIISEGEIDDLKYFVLYQKSLPKDSETTTNLKLLQQKAKAKAWTNFNKTDEK